MKDFFGLSEQQMSSVLLRFLARHDYDSYKTYLPECSEEPEEIEARTKLLVQQFRAALIEVVGV